MARPGPLPESYTNMPSIIIDPSLYLPEHGAVPERCLLQKVCEGFIASTRFLVVVVLPATIVLGVVKEQYRAPQRAAAAPSESAPSERAAAAAARAAAATYTFALVEPVPDAESAPAWLSFEPSAAFVRCAWDRHTLTAARSARPASASTPTSSVASVAPEPLAAPTEWPALRAPLDFGFGARLRAARRLLAQSQLDEAEQAYRKLLAIDERADALMGLARVQLARGEPGDALSLAQRAVSVAPTHAGSRLILGDILRSQGERELSEAEYARAAELSSAQRAPAAASLLPAAPP